MTYITSYKQQNWLLPPNIEDLIPQDHICYIVESFVESLDFSSFDKKYKGAGHPAYHPGIILKILVEGVLDKVRSSRKLARNARENVVYMYLAEKLAPDFRTISDFRKENAALVKDAFRHTISLARQQGLLDLSILSTDGSKIKANASGKRTLTKEELAFLMEFVDKELEEWARQDKIEDEVFSESRGSDQIPNSSKKKMQRAVKHYVRKFKERGGSFREEIKEKLCKANKELVGNNLKKVSTTDAQSRFMKNKKGRSELSYNPQITVDKKGFILANDVCQQTNDTEQLMPQVLQVEENLGSLPANVKWCFDTNYCKGENLSFLEKKGIDGYIPDHELAQIIKGKKPKERFIDTLAYDKEKDIFTTQDGSIFTFLRETFSKQNNIMRRKYVLRKYGKTIKSIRLHAYIAQRDDMRKKMRTMQAQEVYKIRSQTAEPAIGDLKENKGLTAFLTRTLETVKTEFGLACIAHNIRKIAALPNSK